MAIAFNHPAPGQFIKIADKMYEIITHRVEWSVLGMTVETDIQEVVETEDDIEYPDVPEKTVILDNYDYTHIY